MKAIYALEQSDFFKNISSRSKNSLAEICIPKSVGKGETLFYEGDAGQMVYLLATGSVQLHKTSAQGREVVIKVVSPGELFGEIILFEKNAYPVTATVLQEGRLFLMPRRQFYCLLDDSEFRRDFLGLLMARIRFLADQIFVLSTHDVEERFWRFLKSHWGIKQEYKITLSKKAMAAGIGTIPETFSRMIQRLKADGLISWEGSKLILKKNLWVQGNKE